jgi:nitrate/nitrite-specific signal transduction histidine kinase
MSITLQSKLMVLFIGLLLLFLLLLGFSIYLLKIPFFLSLLFSFIIIAPLVYFLGKSITQPIRRMTEMANRLASDGLDRGFYGYSSDELVRLAKAISEMGKPEKKSIFKPFLKV